MGSGQKANETKCTTGIASVQGAEKLTESYLETEKLVRQTPSYTYTTKEIEEQPEAEDAGSETPQIKGDFILMNK